VLPFHPRSIVDREVGEAGFEQCQIRTRRGDAAAARDDRTFGTIKCGSVDEPVQRFGCRDAAAAHILEQQRTREPDRARDIAIAQGVRRIALRFQQLRVAAAVGHREHVFARSAQLRPGARRERRRRVRGYVRRYGSAVRPPLGEAPCEHANVVVAVIAAHPDEPRGVGHVAVIVRDDRCRVADAARTERARECLRRRDASRVGRARIGQIRRVIEVHGAREVFGRIALGARRADAARSAVRGAAGVDDADRSVGEVRAQPGWVDEGSVHASCFAASAGASVKRPPRFSYGCGKSNFRLLMIFGVSTNTTSVSVF
jgi:hypothetical protein